MTALATLPVTFACVLATDFPSNDTSTFRSSPLPFSMLAVTITVPSFDVSNLKFLIYALGTLSRITLCHIPVVRV